MAGFKLVCVCVVVVVVVVLAVHLLRHGDAASEERGGGECCRKMSDAHSIRREKINFLKNLFDGDDLAHLLLTLASLKVRGVPRLRLERS